MGGVRDVVIKLVRAGRQEVKGEVSHSYSFA
jgi:hypothetical protein